MSRVATALIRLYPSDWRRRYGAEMAEMLAAEPLTLRSATDLLAGAIDARLNPHLVPASTTAGVKGVHMTTRMFRCSGAVFSKEDAMRSASWMIGGSLGLTVIGLALQLAIGRNSLTEALYFGAFPASLMLSNESMYFKPYSRPVRLTLSAGGALLIILMMWASVLVAYRI